MAKKRSAANVTGARPTPTRRSTRRNNGEHSEPLETVTAIESSKKGPAAADKDNDRDTLPSKKKIRRNEKAQSSKLEAVNVCLPKDAEMDDKYIHGTCSEERVVVAPETEDDSPMVQEPGADYLDDDDEEDDDDDMDDVMDEWETVDVPELSSQRDDRPEASMPSYKDVEIVFETPKAVSKKSKWEMVYQRNLREWMHHSHVVLLIAHFIIRNRWCAKSEFKALCLSVVPEHIQRQCNLKDQSDKEFDTGLKWLLTWWKDYFNLTAPGFQTRAYHEYSFLSDITDTEVLAVAIDEHGMKDVDVIPDQKAFAEKLVSRSGSSDVSAEIFVTILRSLGFATRLVCSLQPVPHRIPADSRPSSPKKDTVLPSEDAEAEGSSAKKPVKFPFRSPRPVLDPVTEHSSSKAIRTKPPTVWAEVFDPHRDRWVCVDPIRCFHDRSRQMEPPKADRRNQMSFVFAFDEDGDGCTDVTRRYTTHLAQAMKLRERELTRREKEGGLTAWSEHLLNLTRRKRREERELKEEQELDHMEVGEQMPSAIQAFNNHPLYALERHLKKFEVLHPDKPVLGHVKGEKVYPRSSVKSVHTVETWMKLGRVIKVGEQPVKKVNARAVTLMKKRMQELAKQEGEMLQANCYGEWQTEAYQPPPVVNGKVPRNNFGNIDLYSPAMLPAGAAHIPIQGLGKLARQLGIDYADAVVDFEFVSLRSVPVINGIVVPEESKEILLAAWEEHEQIKISKSIEKEQRESLREQEKQMRKELIHARVEAEYGQSSSLPAKADQGEEETSTTSDPMLGGFMGPEDEREEEDEEER